MDQVLTLKHQSVVKIAHQKTLAGEEGMRCFRLVSLERCSASLIKKKPSHRQWLLVGVSLFDASHFFHTGSIRRAGFSFFRPSAQSACINV